jgi:TetR/AcrR family transcriptional regulator, ethionamide resistance regulator
MESRKLKGYSMITSMPDVKVPRKRNSTKGARTRAHIKTIARAIFENEGHAGATAQAIVEAAGVSSGTFYVYFSNKDDVLLQICCEFLDQLISELAKSQTGATPYENIYLGHYAYIRPIVDNWLFYRALISYALVDPRLREIQHQARLREAERTREIIERVWGEMGSSQSVGDPTTALQMAMMLNGMAEGYVQDMLRGFEPNDVLGEDALRATAKMLARTFYRAAYLTDPEHSIDLSRTLRGD